MKTDEAVDLVKMCIDKHVSGEIDLDLWALWQGRKVDILAHPQDVCFVRTNGGDFGILPDGSVVDAVVARSH